VVISAVLPNPPIKKISNKILPEKTDQIKSNQIIFESINETLIIIEIFQLQILDNYDIYEVIQH